MIADTVAQNSIYLFRARKAFAQISRLVSSSILALTLVLSPNLGTLSHARNIVAQGNAPRQLRVFQKLWKVVNDTYVYPNFNGVDWAGKKTEIEAKIAAGMGDGEFYFTLRKLIESLHDDHSVYLPPYVAEELFDLYFNPAA